MSNKFPTRIWYLAICLLIWGVGGPLLITSEVIPSSLLGKEVASLLEISLWTLICAGGGFAGWRLFKKPTESEAPLSPVANVMTFKINKDFSFWAKAFDNDLENQQEAGLKPLFREVSKEDSTKVLAILVAVPGALESYLQKNQEKISKSGQVLGTEEISTYSTTN
ncbi:DUF3764 family protein [Prochlorococcus sp. MIT 1341]|uniref:DUF3764 family protein n=1 Tax=Prochlorococcus sp. MIT 1341 TaxID=3096221 RepID=UPI002A74FEC7|nr:DUF3764 family protein [Prochlorococcus sp. MIT 1341]